MKITNLLLTITNVILFTAHVHGQGVGVNSSGNPPDPSAILDASATDKGMLIPRLSTVQRTAISTPATGLMVYDTNTNSFWYYNGTAWTEIGGGSTGGSGIKDLNFPDGYLNMTPVNATVTYTSPYNVPSGKNLYVTSYWRTSDNTCEFGADNLGVFNNYTWVRSSLPLIAKTNVKCFLSGCSLTFNGFLVDATVTPISFQINNSSSYTVPAGKKLVILQMFMDTQDFLNINGQGVFRGGSNRLGDIYVFAPIVAASSSVLSTVASSCVLNGYLMDN